MSHCPLCPRRFAQFDVIWYKDPGGLLRALRQSQNNLEINSCFCMYLTFSLHRPCWWPRSTQPGMFRNFLQPLNYLLRPDRTASTPSDSLDRTQGRERIYYQTTAGIFNWTANAALQRLISSSWHPSSVFPSLDRHLHPAIEIAASVLQVSHRSNPSVMSIHIYPSEEAFREMAVRKNGHPIQILTNLPGSNCDSFKLVLLIIMLDTSTVLLPCCKDTIQEITLLSTIKYTH